MIMELVKSQGCYHDQAGQQDDPLGHLIQSMSSLNKFQIIDTAIIFCVTSLGQISGGIKINMTSWNLIINIEICWF